MIPLAARKARHAGTAPLAIWAHFAQQAAWKDWVIAALLMLNALTIVAGSRLAAREPDVVLVSAEGKSTYVPRSTASKALLDFIAEQKQQPSDVTVVHFTKDFMQRSLAANSSTIDATWAEALAMMGADLRGRLKRESDAQRLIETYRQLRVKTAVSVEDIVLVERTKDLLQMRATVRRTKSSLLDESKTGVPEHLVVELVERIVPRTADRPDGLEVVDWHFAQPSPVTASTPAASHGQ